MTLAIDTQDTPIIAIMAPPDTQTEGLVPPDQATALHCTVGQLGTQAGYTFASYGLIDDEVKVLDANGKPVDPPATRSTYGPTPFLATEWPEQDGMRREKTGSAHFVVPVNANRRIWVGIVAFDTPGGAPSVVLKAKWI